MRADGINHHLTIRYYATLSEDIIGKLKVAFNQIWQLSVVLCTHMTDYFSTGCCHLTKTGLKDKMRRIFKDHYMLFHKRVVRTKFDIYVCIHLMD